MVPSNMKVRLCAVESVDKDGAVRVETEGLTLAVFNVGGNFYVTDDSCTHGPGSLSEGYLDGFEIECNFHHGRFDIRTGEVVAPPCMIPIKAYKVIVENGELLIEL